MKLELKIKIKDLRKRTCKSNKRSNYNLQYLTDKAVIEPLEPARVVNSTLSMPNPPTYCTSKLCTNIHEMRTAQNTTSDRLTGLKNSHQHIVTQQFSLWAEKM